MWIHSSGFTRYNPGGGFVWRLGLSSVGETWPDSVHDAVYVSGFLGMYGFSRNFLKTYFAT